MFNKLYTPEWFKIVNPINLINKLLACFRLFMPNAFTLKSEVYSFGSRIIKKGYTPFSITASDVLYIKDKDIAGSGSKNIFMYRVLGITDSYELIGCGYTNKIAVLNMDYIINDGVYWFKEHPSIYCYSLVEDNTTIYKTVGFSNKYIHTTNSLSPLTDISDSPEACNYYDTVATNGLSGAINSLYLYQQGVYTTDGVHGLFKYTWRDKDRLFGVTDTGNIISAPLIDKISINLDNKLKIDDTPDYFTVELNNIHYPVSYLSNNVTDYPGLLAKYPALKYYNNIFLGANLYEILKNEGCNFTEITYIDNYTIDNNLLTNSMIKGDKLLYLGNMVIYTGTNITSEISVISTVPPGTPIKDITVDVKYIF